MSGGMRGPRHGMSTRLGCVCVSVLLLSSLHLVEGEHRGYEVIVSVDLDQLAEVESVTPP